MAYDENGDFIQSVDEFDPYAGYTDQQKADIVRAAETYYGGSGKATDVQLGQNYWVNGGIDYADHGPIDWHDPASYQWLINEPGGRKSGGTNPPGYVSPNPTSRSSPNDFPRPSVPNLADFRSPDPLRPWDETFTAPTAEDATNSPGFQFRLGEGLKALERSAAAKGTLLTGGTLKGEQGYAQNLASNEYKDVYGRAYNEYDTRRTNFLQNEANRYNSQRSNLTDQWGFNTDVFGMNRSNRLDDWGISSDYFNQGQAERKTDFDIWNTQDTNAFNKIYQTAMLKKPPSPYSLGY